MHVFNEPLRLVLMALAVFRLTHLVWWEFGPWDIFWRLREWVGVLAINEADDDVVLYGHTFLGKLFSCPLCLSMWIAGGLMALYLMTGPTVTVALDVFCVWLGISAVSLLLFGWHKTT